MTAELDRLTAVPSEPILLKSGTPIQVRRLRTRQFFGLLRIVTRGGFSVLPAINFDTDDENFGTQMMALVIFAIPEAEDEAIEFVQSMVLPASAGEEADAALKEELEDPEFEDLVTVLEVVFRQEADDLKSLGKRLKAMMEVAKKTGQLEETPTKKTTKKTPSQTPRETKLSEVSPQPST